MIPRGNTTRNAKESRPPAHDDAPGTAAFTAAPHTPDRVLLALVAGVYIVSFAMPVASLDRAGMVICLFRRLTDLPCPGCGLTHAFLCLGHGDLAGSLHYHALSLPLFVLGLAWLARALFDRRGTWPRLSEQARQRAMVVGLLAMVIYDLYRILVPSARPF